MCSLASVAAPLYNGAVTRIRTYTTRRGTPKHKALVFQDISTKIYPSTRIFGMAVQVSKRNGKFFGSTAKGEHHTDKLVASSRIYNHNEISRNDLTTCHL